MKSLVMAMWFLMQEAAYGFGMKIVFIIMIMGLVLMENRKIPICFMTSHMLTCHLATFPY